MLHFSNLLTNQITNVYSFFIKLVVILKQIFEQEFGS